jgi:hypothetical protein
LQSPDLHPLGTAAIGSRGFPLRTPSWTLALLLVAAIAIGLAAASDAVDERGRTPALGDSFAGLPMSFVPNRGQAGARGEFVARGPGYEAALTSDGARLALAGSRLDMSFVGAHRDAPIAGASRLPGTVNSYIGDDPARWRTGIPTFEAVRYREPWPGIGVEFHGSQSELQYDFLVAPRADPSRIRLEYGGARSLRIDAAGDLVAAMPGGGEVRQAAPISFQRAGGAREPVDSEFRLLGADRVGIAVGPYDRSRPLVIDPTLSYSNYLGGGDFDSGEALTVDASGSAYVIGRTFSADFPTQNPFQGARSGTQDAFVTKLNPAGTAVIYSTYLGGSNIDSGQAIAVDASGNAYLAGLTRSLDFPVTPGAFQTVAGGGTDGFVAKLNPAGTALVYSTYLAGNGSDAPTGIALDPGGGAYLAGSTLSADFPTTPGAFQTAFAGLGDAFATKLNATGSALIYSTYLGGGSPDGAGGVAVDSSGQASLMGATQSADFPTSSPIQASLQGTQDAFVARLTATGSALGYSTYLGGGGIENGEGIALDAGGSAYLTGATTSADFPTANALQGALAGPVDAYVTKVNPAGTALAYSSFLGGGGVDQGLGTAVDAAGTLRVVGQTNSADFPTANAVQGALAGATDGFAARVAPGGTALRYSTYLGGSGDDFAYAVALDADGDEYVTGQTDSPNFPVANAFQPAIAGSSDAFVTKLGPDATSTALSCAPDTLDVGAKSTCTATVAGGSPPAPSGTVTFASDAQGSFAPAASCALVDAGGGTASCSVDYVPGATGTHAIAAAYPGDAEHAGSSSAPARLSVIAPVGPIEPDTPVEPDSEPPVITLSGKTKQELGGTVKLKAESNEDASGTASGVVGVRAASHFGREARVKRFDVKQRTRELAAGVKTTFELKLTRKAKKSAKQALERGGRAKARLRVEATDEVGNETIVKRVVELTR